MDNKALLEELASHTNILEYHIKRLKKKPDQIHELDKEIIGEKIKEIYNLLFSLDTGEMIGKTEIPADKVVEKIPMVEVKPEPEMPRPSAPEMSSESRVPDDDPPPNAAMDDIRSESEIEDEVAPDAETKDEITEDVSPPAPNPHPVDSILAEETEEKPEAHIEEPAKKHEEPEPPSEEPENSNEESESSSPEPETIEVPKTTADLFSGPTTIADTFQARGDNSIASRVNPPANQDLKMAIGINDKFLFINELFKGDPGVYNQAIENLNAAEGMHEATAVLKTCIGKHGLGIRPSLRGFQ